MGSSGFGEILAQIPVNYKGERGSDARKIEGGEPWITDTPLPDRTLRLTVFHNAR